MGENAFIAFTVVRILGYNWQTAFGAIFIAGLLFTLLTVLKMRVWLADAIPSSLKIAFAVGVGFFLTFVGLNETGIVRLGVAGAPVHVGDLAQSSVLLAIFGFLLMAWLMILRLPVAILAGIAVVTAIALAVGLVPLPDRWIALPPDLSPLFLQLDVVGALTWGMFGVVLTIFVMSFVDTIGTLIGLGYKADLVDADGNMTDIEKPMLCDAVATTVAPLLGTSTSGAYIESATGIQAGGRTGLTAVVTALLFLSALFLAPVFAMVPPYAYGPALIIVGLIMIAPITRLPFDDLTEDGSGVRGDYADELHIQHRHRRDGGLRPLSASQGSFRTGRRGKGGIVGSRGALVALLCLLPVLIYPCGAARTEAQLGVAALAGGCALTPAVIMSRARWTAARSRRCRAAAGGGSGDSPGGEWRFGRAASRGGIRRALLQPPGSR